MQNPRKRLCKTPEQAPFNESELAVSVNKLPVYPEAAEPSGIPEPDGKEMAPYLEEGQTKTYILIEFIIDKRAILLMLKF
jgi:hypothetical protein